MRRRSRLEGLRSGSGANCCMALRSSIRRRRASRLHPIRGRACVQLPRGRAWRLPQEPPRQRRRASFSMCSLSPARTSRAGLALSPLDRILPRSHAREACARVLKKRAAQSHLSMRTVSTKVAREVNKIVSGLPGDFPDIEIVGITCCSYSKPLFVRFTVESGADICFWGRQRGERNFQRQAGLHTMELIEKHGDELPVFSLRPFGT